jgi:hypothetical protein
MFLSGMSGSYRKIKIIKNVLSFQLGRNYLEGYDSDQGNSFSSNCDQKNTGADVKYRKGCNYYNGFKWLILDRAGED